MAQQNTGNSSGSSGSSSSFAPAAAGEERLMVRIYRFCAQSTHTQTPNDHNRLNTTHSSPRALLILFWNWTKKQHYSFKVAVRVRPPATNLPHAARDDKCLQILSKKSLLFDDGTSSFGGAGGSGPSFTTAPSSNKNTSRPRKYTYDHVFDEDATQDEVYQTTTSPLIKDVLRGLSAAVFAYGATGSGKTHTMLGPNPRRAAAAAAVAAALPESGGGVPKTSSPGAGNGLMVKAIDEIFRHVEAAENPSAYRVSDRRAQFVFGILHSG